VFGNFSQFKSNHIVKNKKGDVDMAPPVKVDIKDNIFLSSLALM